MDFENVTGKAQRKCVLRALIARKKLTLGGKKYN